MSGASAWRGRRLDDEERRAVALDTAHIQVAGALMDPGLAPELGLHRLHRQARGLLAAVAAALANALVDPDALGGCLELAALAHPSLLRRTTVVMDQDRHALDGRELGLYLRDLIAVAHRRYLRELNPVVTLRLGRRDHDAAHPLGGELIDEFRN